VIAAVVLALFFVSVGRAELALPAFLCALVWAWLQAGTEQ
jgi:hypothetical protein